MSLETWKQEFYSQPAADVKPELAVDHSLQKWIGLRSGNLKKHGVAILAEGSVYDPKDPACRINIDADSCALCIHFRGCPRCPLFAALNRSCDGDDSVYLHWIRTRNPEPMIAALQKAKENSK